MERALKFAIGGGWDVETCWLTRAVWREDIYKGYGNGLFRRGAKRLYA